MTGFSQFYIQFIQQLWYNFCDIFVSLWKIIENIFYHDWADENIGYIPLLQNSITEYNWNALDYIAFILVLVINVGFVVLFLVLLVQLIRRYIKFVKREVDKDALVEEVSLLNQKVVELID